MSGSLASTRIPPIPLEAGQKPQVGSYLEPDLERVVAAEPDLILATEAHVGTVLPELDALGLPTVVIEPTDLDEVFSGMLLVGTITDMSSRAQQVVCELQARVDAVTDAVAGAPRPRVFFELSPDLYTAGPGSFVDDLISRAGGDNVAAGAAETLAPAERRSGRQCRPGGHPPGGS